MTVIKTDAFGPRGLGYLEIDHRGAEELPPGTKRYFEADTYTCTHCERIVVMNPERKRERYKCSKCNHHICDDCAAAMYAGAECVPVKALADRIQEQAEKGIRWPAMP
jgi:hypothetical protein